MISVNHLSIQFQGINLFRDVSVLVNSKDKIGLVGRNGAGKSTLLKILKGIQKPDSGEVIIPDDITTGYLPQEMTFSDKNTVYDEAASAFYEINKLEKEIKELNKEISEREDHSSPYYAKLIEKYSEKNDRYQLLGAGNKAADIEQTLLGLGFYRDDFNRPTKHFSGGWRMRIELAKILLQLPNVFLLDEPTNHLDIESIQWLENFLKNYSGSVVLISHDRAFLDNVTNRTVEISLGKIYDYKVPYSKYVELHKERREQQAAAYKNQQKKIEETEKFIERFRYKNTKAVQVQSRIKQLAKLEIIEIDNEDNSKIKIKFPPAERSGTIVFQAKSLTKCYGNHTVLENICFTVERGEKIAFVGKNGEGKTTLSKIIIGELDYKGECKIGHNVSTGYFAQNQDELLDDNKTVYETIDQVAVGDIRTKIRDILGAFLFSGEDIDKKVKVLSGGEKSRLALTKLLLKPYNFLVFDEPTNHLDMRSKEILKQALISFNGTLIIVSHDREFLDGLVHKIVEFKNCTIKQYLGTIYEFLESKKLTSLKELEQKKKIDNSIDIKNESLNKSVYKEKKEFDKDLRKIMNKIKSLENDIETLELNIKDMNHIIANPDKNEEKIKEPDFYRIYEKTKSDLEVRLNQWEKLNLEVDKLKNIRN